MLDHSWFLVEDWIRSRVSFPSWTVAALITGSLFIVSFVMTRNAFFGPFFLFFSCVTGSVLGGFGLFYVFHFGFLG